MRMVDTLFGTFNGEVEDFINFGSFFRVEDKEKDYTDQLNSSALKINKESLLHDIEKLQLEIQNAHSDKDKIILLQRKNLLDELLLRLDDMDSICLNYNKIVDSPIIDSVDSSLMDVLLGYLVNKPGEKFYIAKIVGLQELLMQELGIFDSTFLSGMGLTLDDIIDLHGKVTLHESPLWQDNVETALQKQETELLFITMRILSDWVAKTVEMVLLNRDYVVYSIMDSESVEKVLSDIVGYLHSATPKSWHSLDMTLTPLLGVSKHTV